MTTETSTAPTTTRSDHLLTPGVHEPMSDSNEPNHWPAPEEEERDG